MDPVVEFACLAFAASCSEGGAGWVGFVVEMCLHISIDLRR
jgi:hypothetical protein